MKSFNPFDTPDRFGHLTEKQLRLALNRSAVSPKDLEAVLEKTAAEMRAVTEAAIHDLLSGAKGGTRRAAPGRTKSTGGATGPKARKVTSRKARSKSARSAKSSNGNGHTGSSGLSAAQRASRKIQGAYLGRIRQVKSAKAKAQFQRIAKEEGRERAIIAINEYLGAQ